MEGETYINSFFRFTTGSRPCRIVTKLHDEIYEKFRASIQKLLQVVEETQVMTEIPFKESGERN